MGAPAQPPSPGDTRRVDEGAGRPAGRRVACPAPSIKLTQNDANETINAVKATETAIMQMNEIQSGIAAATEQQSATAAEISENVEQAAKGTGEIAAGITGVAACAEQTQTGATDVARSAEHLLSFAEELNKLVSGFKTADTKSAA